MSSFEINVSSCKNLYYLKLWIKINITVNMSNNNQNSLVQFIYTSGCPCPSDTENGRTDGRTHTETLNPRGYPLHWVIPITDTPKRIPITLSDTLMLSDTDTLSDFSSHWEFSQPTQEFIHDTEGPWFPYKQTGHWVIPITLRDTPDTELYPLP